MSLLKHGPPHSTFEQHTVGLVERSRTKNENSLVTCDPNTTGPITFHALITAFLLLAVVAVLAVLVLVMEIVFYKRCRRRRAKLRAMEHNNRWTDMELTRKMNREKMLRYDEKRYTTHQGD